MKVLLFELLITFYYIVLCVSTELNKIIEEKTSGCVASLSTASGTKWIYLLDDYELIGDNKYNYTSPSKKYTFLWRPCSSFNISEERASDCYGSYVALLAREESLCSSLGRTASFHATDTGLQVVYRSSDDSKSATNATVKLICNESQEVSSFTCAANCEGYNPVFMFYSKYTCLRNHPVSMLPSYHKLSLGSLCLIVFGFIFFIYLITGTIRGFIKGRTGLDRLPNSDFWLELPLLVKDGCCLICGCRLPFKYRMSRLKKEIYQPILYDETSPMDEV